jgi:hypothetical protein
MKNYIKKSALSILIGSSLFMTGCSNFLDEQDPSNLSPESYYTIPEHADAAIYATYARARFIGSGAGIFSANFQMLDAPTGTAATATSQNSDLNNLLGLVYDGDNLHVRQFWTGAYRVIAQANLALDKIPGINPMDEAQKKRTLGEAAFMRAWSYFYIVRLWGSTPLITKPQTPESPDFYPVRTSVDSVYNQIVADLKMAEESGLPWTDASGRVGLAAIKTELAKVYLTMAGYPLGKGKEYYKLAADKAKEVIDYAAGASSGIMLGTYDQLHTVTNNNKVEHLFQVQYLADIEQNPMQSLMLPNNSLAKNISAMGSGVGSSIPTSSFYDSYKKFEPTDKRTDDKQFFFTSYFVDGKGAAFTLDRPYIFKHFDYAAHGVQGTDGTGRSNLNMMNIRFAETLLIYAEAQNQADDNPNTAAYDALNRVRTRANLPILSGLSKTAFEEAVWRERWHEFAYEGITWFDMVRLKKVYNEDTNGFDNFEGHINKNSGKALEAKHLLFPLPIQEIRNNPNLRPQNPGYGA